MDRPKEKSSFNQQRLIWDKDGRCLSGEGKNPTGDIISTTAAFIVITSTNDLLNSCKGILVEI